MEMATHRDTPSWREILVTGGAADDMILDVVRPVHEATRDAGPAFFWREPAGGLRYRLAADESTVSDVTARLTAEAQPRAAEVTLLTPGTERVEIGDVVGGPTGEALTARFLSEAAGLVFDILTGVRDGTLVRAQVAFDLMASTMVAINRHLFDSVRDYDYPTSFICFRSSADGFLLLCRDPAQSRARFDAVYAGRAEDFRNRLAAVLAQCQEGTSPASGPAAGWLSRIDPRIPYLRTEVGRGGIATPAHSTGYIGDQFDLAPSPFHQVIQDSPTFQTFMRTDADFQTMRVSLALLAAVLYQCGIRPVDRYALSHCLARAAEDLFGASATQVLADLPEMRARADPEATG